MVDGSMETLRTVAVIGAGAMGRGIAVVAAKAGHDVLLYDVVSEFSRQSIEVCRNDYEALIKRNKISVDEVNSILSRITPVENLQEVKPAQLVIEAIIEDIQVKEKLFLELESIIGNETLLTTNTSSLSITRLSQKLSRPANFAGFHFFNPAQIMPLVEVVKGAATSKTVTDTLVDLAKLWGKTPVLCNSTPGFIVNRVARPFYGEAMRLLNEGAVDAVTIDTLMRESGGFRMGPLELTDLIGQDVNFSVTRTVYENFFYDPRYRPSLVQQELVFAGHLGRKTGKGFYRYDEQAPIYSIKTAPPGLCPDKIIIKGDLGSVQILAKLAEDKGIDVQRKPGLGTIQIDDINLSLTDGRTATERAQSDGPNALFDLALDYQAATCVAVAFSDNSTQQQRYAVCGFFQALGKKVVVIDDVAGMVVMATVAMLINEAVDALNQSVASAADIDLAMVKGVNYPIGLLAWADKLGAHLVLSVLENLNKMNPEGRYRPSPLLRRRALHPTPFLSSEEPE